MPDSHGGKQWTIPSDSGSALIADNPDMLEFAAAKDLGKPASGTFKLFANSKWWNVQAFERGLVLVCVEDWTSVRVIT